MARAKVGASPEASDATRDTVADWLASLADELRLKPASIAGYRSAASTWWIEQTRSGGENPFQHEFVGRVLKGIKNEQRPSPSAPAVTAPTRLTVELLTLLEGALRDGGTARGMLMWAICCLGVSAMPRPVELFGVASGQLARPPPQLSSLVFFDTGGARIDAKEARADRPTPVRFTWDIGRSKADQHGKRGATPVAAAYAVRAIWAWCCYRAELGAPSVDIFHLDGAVITQHAVLRALEAAHKTQDLGPAVFQGKCFRQGGAASQVAAGVAVDDIASAGRWKSGTMPILYGGVDASFQRRLLVSAATDPRRAAASYSSASGFGSSANRPSQ